MGDSRPSVYWTGGFFTNASLAIVNRRLVTALIVRGNLNLSIGTDPVAPGTLPPDLHMLAGVALAPERTPDVTVVHEFPPRFAVPASSRYVHIQPWEFGSMPLEWFRALHDDCDEIWTHSTVNRDGYVEDGISPERVAVIPHGIDTAIFTPEGPKMAPTAAGNAFRFLFVGGTIYRKGIDLLLRAYHRAFRRSDHVVLTIKDVNPNTFYKGHSQRDEILALTHRSDLARIEYTDGIFPDAAMGQLYRAADCLVLPYRGEGFAMPVLEAMGCGRPAIVTDGGATDDFVDESVGWKIRATPRSLKSGEPLETVRTASMLEPDVDALTAAMRFAFHNRDEVRRRGEAAAQRARAWTWDRAAAIAEERILALLERPPVPAKMRGRRYADPERYFERIYGSGGLDSLLLELYRRVGMHGSTFVEITDRGAIAVAPVLARGMRWTGVAIERDTTRSEAMRERFADSPKTTLLLGDSSPATIVRTLAENGIEAEFDLLSLGCPDATDLLGALLALRPRAIACTKQQLDGIERAATSYVCLAIEPQHGDALLLRKDLLERSGFVPAQRAAVAP